MYNVRKRTFVDKTSSLLDGFFKAVSFRLLKQNPRELVEINTTFGEHALLYSNGTLVSAIEISGGYKAILTDEYEDIIDELDTQLSSYMTDGMSDFSWYFMLDDNLSGREIDKNYKLSALQTAKRLKLLNYESIINEQANVLGQYCHGERNLLLIYTKPAGLTKEEAKQLEEYQKKVGENCPFMLDSQLIATGAGHYYNKHNALVKNIINDLSEMEISVSLLDRHSFLREIRYAIDADLTGLEWRPILEGDEYTVSLPELGESDYSPLGLPKLNKQLVPRSMLQPTFSTVEIGSKIYAPVSIELHAKKVRPFNKLLKTLKAEGIPFRIRYDIGANGLNLLSTKEGIASITRMTPGTEDNKKIVEVKKVLTEIADKADIIKLQVVLCTWAPKDDARLLAARVELLVRALQAWGGSQAAPAEGDSVESFFSSVPGATKGSVGNPAAPPLSEALKMMPIGRQGSPWLSGSMPLRTVDGKLWFYQPYSPKQESWITTVFGPMGSGKSVFLGYYNLSLLLHDDCTNLPYISIIDVGPSSKGFISLVRSMLPKDRKHLAVYKRLQNTLEYAINAFDTLHGVRFPISGHKTFLVTFLSFLSEDESTKKIVDGTTGFLSNLIDLAYKRCAERQTANLYVKGVEPDIDEKVLGIMDTPEMAGRQKITWWDVTDYLYQIGETYLSSVAQRRAVPTLPSLIPLCEDPKIKGIYEDVEVSPGQSLPRYIARKLTEAINKYPVVSSPTKFDIGAARIVSLDLDNVTKGRGHEAKKQLGLMYLLSYQLLTSRFYLGDETLEEVAKFESFNSTQSTRTFTVDYKPALEKHIRELKSLPKRFCIDEKHRIRGLDDVESQIDEAIAESRKWKVELVQVSQLPYDFSEKTLELSTNTFILGAGGERNIATIVKTFNLSESMEWHLRNSMRKPNKTGSRFLGIFKTANNTTEQLLMSTNGSRFLWAMNSTRNDSYVRGELEKRIGIDATREALVALFPGGSLDDEIEARRKELGVRAMASDYQSEDMTGDGTVEHINSDEDRGILDEIVEQVFMKYKNGLIRAA